MRKPAQSDLDRVITRTRGRIKRLVAQYAAGDLTPQTFGDSLLAVLSDRHAKAASLGRQRAGDMTPHGDDDELFGALTAEGESHYAARFVADLAAGRYVDPDGTLRDDLIRNRALLYAQKLTASANEAFAGASNEPVWFRLGPEPHCTLCPQLAAASPYPPGAAPLLPVHVHCKCHYETESAMGFRPTP